MKKRRFIWNWFKYYLRISEGKHAMRKLQSYAQMGEIFIPPLTIFIDYDGKDFKTFLNENFDGDKEVLTEMIKKLVTVLDDLIQVVFPNKINSSDISVMDTLNEFKGAKISERTDKLTELSAINKSSYIKVLSKNISDCKKKRDVFQDTEIVLTEILTALKKDRIIFVRSILIGVFNDWKAEVIATYSGVKTKSTITERIKHKLFGITPSTFLDTFSEVYNIFYKGVTAYFDKLIQEKDTLNFAQKHINNDNAVEPDILFQKNRNVIKEIFDSYGKNNRVCYFFKSQEDYDYTLDVLAKYFCGELLKSDKHIILNNRTKSNLSRALRDTHKQCSEMPFSTNNKFHQFILSLFPRTYKNVQGVKNIQKR